MVDQRVMDKRTNVIMIQIIQCQGTYSNICRFLKGKKVQVKNTNLPTIMLLNQTFHKRFERPLFHFTPGLLKFDHSISLRVRPLEKLFSPIGAPSGTLPNIICVQSTSLHVEIKVKNQQVMTVSSGHF